MSRNTTLQIVTEAQYIIGRDGYVRTAQLTPRVDAYKDTVSDTLKALEEEGHLYRESEQAHTFRPSGSYEELCQFVYEQHSDEEEEQEKVEA